MVKKIVCDSKSGKIYDAEIVAPGKMDYTWTRVATNECINAVAEHLLYEMKKYNGFGAAGYEWPKAEGEGHYRLVLFDDTKYRLQEIEEENNG